MITLRQFQLEGCRQIYHFGGRALLADEMGLGKTIQSLYWILRLRKRRPVVIVAPASMKWTWQAEALHHFNLRVDVLEGQCSNVGKRITSPIVVVNYDILVSWLGPILRMRPEIVVFDECHFIANMTAQRTKAAHRITQWASSVLALSGTPLTNRPCELWSVLHIVRPEIFPERIKFLWRYCQPRHTKWGWKFDGAAHLGELHSILRETCMIRRLKKQVAKELPDKEHRVIPFELKDYSEYNKARDEFIEWLSLQSPSRAKKAKRSLAIVKIGYLLRLCAQLKRKWVIKWLNDFKTAHPGEKLVGMTMHRAVIDYLQEAFPKECVIIDGRVKGRKRMETVRQFQNNKRVLFLFGNWKAAGIGITLTAARWLVSFDCPWSAGTMVQGHDRVHRIGQTRKVIICYLVLLHTVEEKLIRILQKKTKVLDAVLDGKENAPDLDVFNSVIKSFYDKT